MEHNDDTRGNNDMNYGAIMDHRTAADIRPATREELRMSLRAARYDGGCGVFLDVDGTRVYVTGESPEAAAEVMA